MNLEPRSSNPHLQTTKSLHKKSDLCSSSQFNNLTSLIKNCIFHGRAKQALTIYTRYRCTGSVSTLGALPLALKACASLSLLTLGQSLHAESLKTGIEVDVMVGTALVDMYGKCGGRGALIDARKLFDDMPDTNVRTWNAMIGGYMRASDLNSATLLFEEMQFRTSVTWNQMIDGFAKNNNMVLARQLFDTMPEELRTVVTWTVMVDGYASSGEMEAARQLFDMMPKRNFYVWSSMISGYFKKGKVEEATDMFNRMTSRNLVNWNSLIAGFAQNGFSKLALDAFRRMQMEGFEPDEFTLVSILSACAQLGFLDTGKEIHGMAIQKGIQLNHFVLNALVDMYAKCGDLQIAQSIFEDIPSRTTSAWNALILGFAMHGQCREAIELFSKMEMSNGGKPDAITFVVVLSACAHAGFVEEGLHIFAKMEKHGVTPCIKHYGCIADLLGRAGRIREAYDLIKAMPVPPNETILGALLGACRIHADTDMAEPLLEDVEKLKGGRGSDDSAHYVLLSSMYATSEKWEKAESMRVTLLNKCPKKKTAGFSSVILKGSERNVSTYTTEF
ncbi:OLC1v1021120C1 [Oldenlandia corymbosa var. corymbosa]|uniref:OLC1v1021120C1 n=1 Tax=Oldenlandia corymbosa var. corymbosa TaxID=529605 RepID=A0AAV1BVL3_OLDCO|nr:OLC1v1021120C1 [Oldenlandia corymbosa var. corymbosa]